MSGIQYDPSRRDYQENLPQLLRRIAVGLTGLQKRLILDLRKILRRYKSPLLDSLAANLATLLPAAGAQSKTSCPSITGEVTSPPDSWGKPEAYHPVLRQYCCRYRLDE